MASLSFPCKLAGCVTVVFGLVFAAVPSGILRSAPLPADVIGTGELAMRDAIVRSVAALIDAGAVDGLDSLAGEFRNGIRTAAGVWKLTLFHVAIARHSAAFASDPDRAAGILQGLANWRLRPASSPTATIAEASAILAVLRPRLQRTSLQHISLLTQSAALAMLGELRDRLDGDADRLAADPHYFVLRLELGATLGEPASHLAAVAEQGLRRYPDYTQLYFAALDWLPTFERIDASSLDGLARLSQSDGRTEAHFGIYARLVWHLVNRNPTAAPALIRELDWNKVKLGISVVVGDYPDAWNVNNFAFIACLAGDHETAAGLFESIGEPVAEAWPEVEMFERCQEWAGSPPASSGTAIPARG